MEIVLAQAHEGLIGSTIVLLAAKMAVSVEGVGEYLGLFAGTFVCVFVAALGDRTATLKGSLILGFGVALAGSLLFVYVLQSPFPMFKWDF